MSWIVAIVAPAVAAQAALSMDTSELEEGQTVELRLVVSDTDARGYPKIPAPDGLSITFQGQAQQRTIINFQMSYATHYTYALVGTKAGNYTVGPVSVETSAGVLATAPLSLVVVPRRANAVEKLGVTMPSEAWVGQTLLYALKFTTARQMIKGRWGLPESDAFVAEPNVEVVSNEFSIQEGATTLSVQELSYAVRATRAGTTTLSGAMLQAQFPVQRRRRPSGLIDPGLGLFTDVATEVFAADPQKVEVRALPPGAPAGFKGLVGHFSIEMNPSATELRVGETVTLDVRVRGDGSLFDVQLPKLPGEGFRVYDDQPLVSSEIARGRFVSGAVFKRAVVAERPGTIEVPAIELSYFDPTLGSYALAATSPLSLSVVGDSRPAEVRSFGVPVSTGVDTVGEDILPIRTAVTPGQPIPLGYAGLLLVPGAALLGVELAGRLRRRPKAEAPTRINLDQLPEDPEERARCVERAFREEVARRLAVPAEALRREQLGGLGADAEEAEEIYRSLESARYGGGSSLPESRVRAFVKRGDA